MIYNKRRYNKALAKWKADNNLPADAKPMPKPQLIINESAINLARRLSAWHNNLALWSTAPKIEDYQMTWKSWYLLIPLVILLFVGPALYGLLCKNETKSQSERYPNKPQMAFICTGPSSRAYHVDLNCYGLQNCSGDIEDMTVEEARDLGRKPCRYCCK